MESKSSDWRFSSLRWIAWVALCAGMVFEIFLIREAGLAVITRSWAVKALQQQATGKLLDASQFNQYINFDQMLLMFFIAIIAVAFVVGMEYYLRYGQNNGHLLRRIGILFGIEAVILAIVTAIRLFV